MQEALKHRLFFIISITFILLNAVALPFEFYWLHALPAVLIFLFLILFRLDWLVLVLVFLIPLSVNVNDVGYGLGISLPNEPLTILLMAFAVFKFLIDGEYDTAVFRHPITKALFINLVWVLITCFASEQPLVSLKYFMSRFWFVVVFYFLSIALFKQFSHIRRYLWLYIVPLCLVVLYTLYEHSAYNFLQQHSFTIMQPFYVGHGVYAAAIAFFVPFLFICLIFPDQMGIRVAWWPVVAGVLILFLVAIFFSYTRAAWLSIVAAALALIPLLLRMRLATMLGLLVSVIGLGLLFSSQLLYLMSRNDDASSKDLSEHINSISNIKTDASNAERINRWVCAIEMFKERPVFGWGPGTYMFEYAPFQLAKYRTVISTNFGDGGNSHSEYLNPLCEMGLLGLLTLLYLLYQVLNTGFNLYYHATKPRVRLLALAIVLGMVTYLTHGLMNNYSETDKIAVLFWGGFGMITALDTYHSKKPKSSGHTNEAA